MKNDVLERLNDGGERISLEVFLYTYEENIGSCRNQ